MVGSILVTMIGPPRSTRVLAILLAIPAMIGAQTPAPLGRADAIARALGAAPALRIAAADTAMAAGALLDARLLADPTLSTSWTKSVPRWHAEVEWPLGLFGSRGAATRAARAWRQVADVRWQVVLASVVTAVDTSYTRALEARDRAELSRLDADDATELLRIATARRDAGDASSFEVELARLESGRLAAAASSDSLAATGAMLDLQLAIGTGDSAWTLSDSMAIPLGPPPASPPAPLAVRSAQAALTAAGLDVAAARRARFPGINLLTGIEFGDPSGGESGVLPVLGLSIPLPLYNRERGRVAMAEAGRDRADAELVSTRAEIASLMTRTRRAATVARDLLARDETLLASADQVVTMSRSAYREGESPLSAVIEARRTAREIRQAHLTHVADLLVADAVLRFLATPETGSMP